MDDVLVFSGASLAIAGGLTALLTACVVISLIMCAAGLICVLATFYFN